jgi:hypothetical protein
MMCRYQEEVLVEAKLGKNVAIFIPTGSGKTFVVIKYIQVSLKYPPPPPRLHTTTHTYTVSILHSSAISDAIALKLAFLFFHMHARTYPACVTIYSFILLVFPPGTSGKGCDEPSDVSGTKSETGRTTIHSFFQVFSQDHLLQMWKNEKLSCPLF